MAYGCVRTDNMSGTTLGKNLVSLKYQEGGVDAAIENGNIVVVGALIEGEREVRVATAPEATSPIGKLALVASEEVVKSKKQNTLDEFKNEAGDIIRGYRLVSKDIFSVTAEALHIAEGVVPAVGYAVEVSTGTKMSVVESATEGSTQIGTIIEIADGWYVIEVA